MYERITLAKKMERADAILELSTIETQIYKNISEIADSSFVHCGNLDPESCKNVHNMLLKHVEDTRNKILKK